MTSTLDLGSNYTLEENNNGNLLIKDSTGTVVLKHTDGGDFSLGAALELGDLVDGSTGDTVYDGSTETLGDGNQDVDANSINTDQVAVAELGAMIVGDGNKQTISPGSNVTLTNVATRFEDRAIVSVDTTTGIATVQKDGTYAVSGLAHWDSDPGWSAGDSATIRIRAPTTPVENQANHTGIDMVESRPLPLAQVQLSANDEIKLECFNGSGANKRVLGVARKLTLSIWRVRA